ncbi:MAG: hypothetical protein KAJ51_17100, partial [Thermoplasmata archaeon]|nr:hypothetical protein [Thermoplasmata archaeon]
MKFKLHNKITIGIILLVIASLILLNLNLQPQTSPSAGAQDNIAPVAQGFNYVDLNITGESIVLSTDSAKPGESVQIETIVSNTGTVSAVFDVGIYIQSGMIRREIHTLRNRNVAQNNTTRVDYTWTVPSNLDMGVYSLVIVLNVTNLAGDVNTINNEASASIIIKTGEEDSTLEIETKRPYSYPGKKLRIFAKLTNNEAQPITATMKFYYYPANDTISNSTLINNLTLQVDAASTAEADFVWNLSENISLGRYILRAEVVEPDYLGYISGNITFKVIEFPDTSKTPTYLQLWFIIGLIALIIFFLTIIFSLIGVIPQDRLPIQPALVVMALVIMIIGLIGNYLDPSVHLIGAQDIAGMVIIHPITALTAGFLVAGGLEAAGAFAAAADALGRIEKLKFKGRTVFGLVGTVAILTNVPTLIAMPCGRILAAALMPAALFFGYRVAKVMGDAKMVGVVVFPFIVNAAASCGPSPLGGIGTIGEGLSKMPIGSFTTAQSTGIMLATGVCALFMRYITFMRPADLSDEDIRKEMEVETKAGITEEDLKDVAYDPNKNGNPTNLTSKTEKGDLEVNPQSKGPPPSESDKI